MGTGEGGKDKPVCIEAKVPAALKATLSQRPDTVQQASMGMSVYARWTSSWRRDSQLRRGGGLVGRSSWEGLSVIAAIPYGCMACLCVYYVSNWEQASAARASNRAYEVYQSPSESPPECQT